MYIIQPPLCGIRLCRVIRLVCCSLGSVTDAGVVLQTFATERPKLEKVIETFKIVK